MIDLKDFGLSDVWVENDGKDVSIYLMGKVDYVKDKYTEKDLVATELWFVISNYKDENAMAIDSIMISPVRYDRRYEEYEDYDWKDLDEDELFDVTIARKLVDWAIKEKMLKEDK